MATSNKDQFGLAGVQFQVIEFGPVCYKIHICLEIDSILIIRYWFIKQNVISK